MLSYRICICDDDLPIRTLLHDIILAYSIQKDVDISIIELAEAQDLLNKENEYDILFLDIRFNGKNTGIDIAKELRRRGNDTLIVLITSLSSMSIEGYTAEAFRFVVKPFTSEQIISVIDECLAKLKRGNQSIAIKYDNGIEFVKLNSIYYIHSTRRKRIVVCEDRQLITWASLTDLYNNLPKENFEYAGKSYIINMEYIDILKGSTITMLDGHTINIGRKYKEPLYAAFHRLLGG